MPLKGFRLLLVGICLLLPSATWAQQYTVIMLGPNIYSLARAINARGQVVGEAGAGTYRAFLWSDGTRQDLGLLPGAAGCSARAINDSGQVVGWCRYLTNDSQAFLWTAETGMTALPIPDPSGATGINNQGHIVGWQGDPAHAFLYRDGAVEDLGPGHAGINDQDQVVGYDDGETEETFVARLWDQAGPHDLDDEGGSSVAWAISVSGVIAGRSTRGWAPRGLPFHAVLWTPDGISDLGTLPGGPPGNDSSQAFAISGDFIVGNSNSSAFLYDTNGPGYPVNLNDLIPRHSGWLLNYATGINATGQIVGSGDRFGEVYAFLLTPVEPSSIPQY
jgi:probable HAF family extracellular repeat protein